MTTYRVLIPWKSADGEHQPDDEVELTPQTTAEKVEVERLITYGVIETVEESR